MTCFAKGPRRLERKGKSQIGLAVLLLSHAVGFPVQGHSIQVRLRLRNPNLAVIRVLTVHQDFETAL